MSQIVGSPSAPKGQELPGVGLGEDLTLGSQGSIEVPVVAVVELLDGVDLIKLDIEGLEAEVLSAGMEMILSNRPTIFVEVLRKAVRLREVISELHSHGYVACSVGESLRVLTTDEIAEINAYYGTV